MPVGVHLYLRGYESSRSQFSAVGFLFTLAAMNLVKHLNFRCLRLVFAVRLLGVQQPSDLCWWFCCFQAYKCHFNVSHLAGCFYSFLSVFLDLFESH